MAFFYPRKQTVIIFLFCTLTVGGTAYYVLGGQQVAKPVAKVVISANPTVAEQPIIAANDDWKEQFINTATAKRPASGTKNTDQTTLTDDFGRNFLARYMTLQHSGQFDDSAAVEQHFNDLASAVLSAEKPVEYKVRDISEVADSPVAIDAWKRGVTDALTYYTWTENEAMIARDSMDREDPGILKRIDPIIAGYAKIISVLKKTPTPESQTLTMVDLLNAFSKLQFSAQLFRSMNSDPIKGMLAINSYTEGTDKLVSALQAADAALKNRGIVMEVNSRVLSVPFYY